MIKPCLLWCLLLSAITVYGQTPLQFSKVDKQRLIVLTDITNEPDDQQSLVRLLVYANEYELEGLVATTSVHLKNQVRKDKIAELVTAYGQVRDKLEQHAGGYPSASQLHAITSTHLPVYGMQGVGKGKDSEGSDLIIRAADKADERPLWISVWGGASCLAQALWKVKETRSAEELRRFVAKIRVYAISDQDDAGWWIRRSFPALFYIVSPSSDHWEEYYRATWTGISGDRHYKNGPGYYAELVENPWLTEHIMKNHGPLGAHYPPLAYIMEGDTPSFLGLINNGLGSALSPAYGGWGGRYVFTRPYGETASIWTNTFFSVDEVSLDDGRTLASDQATIWRWREAFQHDFAARMDWCVADTYDKANHNPVVVINGNRTKAVAYADIAAGSSVQLSAKGSADPDNHQLSYRWFVYREAGRYTGDWVPEHTTAEDIKFNMPELEKGQELHIICEVKDNGTPSLFSYRRIVLRQE